jgi:hypothetical protein
MEFLDEQETKQPLYTIQPMPELKVSETTTADNTGGPHEAKAND